MTSDPLRNQFLAVAHDQVDKLPYELDTDASRLLEAKIERGVETMRTEGQTDDQDIALAKQHLREMLQEAGDRAVALQPGGFVVLADGLESLSPTNRFWPFPF
jgi:copper homeostasis protein CutC